MKRGFCLLLALVAICATVVLPLPVAAGADVITQLHYTLPPAEEGGTAPTGILEDGQNFYSIPTVTWDADALDVSVNGEVAPQGSVTLTTAGRYRLVVRAKDDPQGEGLIYTVIVWPDVNLQNDQVFVNYPTLTFTNVVKGMLDEGLLGTGKNVPISSGDEVRGLGVHTLTLYGRAEGGGLFPFRYTFYIKACTTRHFFDEVTGFNTIEVIQGSFDDIVLEVTLDGQPMTGATALLTKVGAHTLAVKANGNDLQDVYAMPTAAELSLRVPLALEALETDAPFWLDLRGWDGDFRLDGEPISGLVRITKAGTHTVYVANESGRAVANAFELTLPTQAEPQVLSELTYTFNNPHLTYVIIVAIPAALLLVGAVVFLLKRRTII